MPYCVAALVSLSAIAADQDVWNQNWPQWRGPVGSGAAPNATPPLAWSETNNIHWKVEIPGSGASTPIVWHDKVFLLSAIPTGKKAQSSDSDVENSPDPSRPDPSNRRRGGPKPDELQRFVVLCLDRETGRVLWQQTANELLPHEGHHQDHGFASASPVTDGEHLLAYFGSRGLYCYDLDGNLKWDVDFGDMQTRNSFGEGSSPALHGDTVVVLWDHEGDDDFLVALDKSTGKERWRTPREEATSWTTPVVATIDGKPQVIVSGTSAIRGYDLATGRELWTGPGLTANVIPTPIVAGDVLYAMSGFRGASLQVLKLGGSGDLAGSEAVLWSYNRNTPYVPSPLLINGLLYFVSGNNAILSCLDADSGSVNFSAERLEGINGIYASPVAARGHLYVLGRNGVCLVLSEGPELKIVAANKLDEETEASPAMAGRDLFIRGHSSLYCLRDQ